MLYGWSAEPLELSAAREAAGGDRLIALGACVGALGATLFLYAGGATGGERSRWTHLAAGLAVSVAAVPWILPQRAATLFSPWYQVTIEPELVIEAPEGLLTVEPTRSGTAVATLDRRRLTPLAEEEAADEQCLDAALAVDALHPLALDTRGLVWLEEGRFEDAAASFRAAVRSDPHYASAWSHYGRALVMSGEVDGAREALTRALALHPGAREARKLLCRIAPEAARP